MAVKDAIEQLRIAADLGLMRPREAKCAEELISEIDSLRVQLAEAEANAVPWRDGPVQDSDVLDGDVFFAVIDFRDGMEVVKGYREGGTIYYDQAWICTERVVRWCRESDLIPTAAKAEVKP